MPLHEARDACHARYCNTQQMLLHCGLLHLKEQQQQQQQQHEGRSNKGRDCLDISQRLIVCELQVRKCELERLKRGQKRQNAANDRGHRLPT